jgi:hypothetical protein
MYSKILLNAVHRVSAIPIKIPTSFFTERGNQSKNSSRSIKDPNNQSNTGGITTPDFKRYYQATGAKTAWYCHKHRHGTNGIEEPEINPCRYSQRCQNHTMKKRQPLQQTVLGKLDIHMHED